MTSTPSEQAAAVLNLIECGVIAWEDPEVVMVLRDALKHDAPWPIRPQRSYEPSKSHQMAPSGRMTKAQRARIPHIRVELAQQGITPQHWELQALARGATVIYEGEKFSYPVPDEWT
jgi:large subunit ribosomal protein L30